MKNWQKKTLACLLGLLLLCGGTRTYAGVAGVKGAPAQSQTTHTEAAKSAECAT